MPDTDPVRLTIFDALGRRVRVLVNGPLDVGQHRVTWDGFDEDGRRVGGGLYVYSLETQEALFTGRMMMLK